MAEVGPELCRSVTQNPEIMRQMWFNPIVQASAERLRKLGVH